MSIALVTGASRGIGRACALALAKRGYDVAVNYVSNEAAAQAVVAEIEALGVRSLAAVSYTHLDVYKRQVQGLLELAGIPYVGCGVLASAVCMDKAVANALFEANGVPHTRWLAADRWEIESDLEGVCEGVEKKLGWPVFVKPANAGSSVGISKVSSRDELKKAIDLALENDRKVVFEAFVDGQEVECAVIGSDPAVATRPGEILAGAEFYTYDDKYKNGVSQTVIPAHLPEAKLDEVKTYAAMA